MNRGSRGSETLAGSREIIPVPAARGKTGVLNKRSRLDGPSTLRRTKAGFFLVSDSLPIECAGDSLNDFTRYKDAEVESLYPTKVQNG